MTRPTPKWRQAFDRVERAIGAPLEDVANSGRFMDVMSVGIRVRRAAGGKVAGVVHGVAGGLLHAINIPTRDDVRTLNSHLVTLAGEVREIEAAQRRAVTSRRTSKSAPDRDDD